MCGFHLGDFVGEAKRGKRWSNHIWICGGGVPSKKVDQATFFQIDKVFFFGAKWRVKWREFVAIDQLERRNIKNAHFENGAPLACISNFGFVFEFCICSWLLLYHLISCVLCTCSLYFSFALYCSINVIHITHGPHASFDIYLAFTYCFTLTAP